MALFFNGRLHVSPATISRVDDSALANKNLTVGNVLAVIGTSEGGQPNTALAFGNPSDARAVLRSGELLQAVEKAFAPSSEVNAPSRVVAVRVNPALRASLSLQASAANVIALKATDYGLHTNQIKVKVETGANLGKRVTAQQGSDVYSADDIYRKALSVVYTGAQATATISITNTAVTLFAPAATPVATIDLNTYDTVQSLVDRINAVADFTAAVLEGNATKPTLNGLDSVNAQSVKAATYTVRADLQAVVDWINGAGEGFLDAERVAGAGAPPDNIAFTYLSGGTDGIVTTTEWGNAFTVLQGEDVQWLVPLTSDAAIHAMASAHATYMSDVGKKERRALVGGAIGQTIAQAKDAAKALNTDRVSHVYPGHYDYDSDGNLTLYAPYLTAAILAAAFAGSDPGTALTNKSLNVRGLETKLRNPTDTDDLILGGVLCVEDTPSGYRVVKSISTWLTNANYNRVEVSTGFAMDFVSRNVRQALDVLRGERGSPRTLARAVSIAETALKELARPVPSGPGVIVGNDENPPFKSIEASLDGDVLRVQFQCSPVIPVNYIPVTIFAVPFSATAAG